MTPKRFDRAAYDRAMNALGNVLFCLFVLLLLLIGRVFGRS